MEYSETLIAFLNEAQFTRDILGIGVTQIRKANYAYKGIYYQSFTCLATGLERLGKMCLILDYYIDNKGKFPDINYMKKSIGHNIISIYKEAINIINKRNLKLEFLRDLDGDIHKNILNVLSEFAMGDRYSNIDAILGRKQNNDSMQKWYESVDMELYDKRVTKQKKIKIKGNADLVGILMQDITLVRHVSEDKKSIDSVQDASLRTGIQEAVAPYRQLYVLQIIRFLVEVLGSLQDIAMRMSDDFVIPHFREIFVLFYNEDSYLKTRKTFDTMY